MLSNDTPGIVISLKKLLKIGESVNKASKMEEKNTQNMVVLDKLANAILQISRKVIAHLNAKEIQEIYSTVAKMCFFAGKLNLHFVFLNEIISLGILENPLDLNPAISSLPESSISIMKVFSNHDSFDIDISQIGETTPIPLDYNVHFDHLKMCIALHQTPPKAFISSIYTLN